MAATDLERLVASLDLDIKKFERELKRANNVADREFRQVERRGSIATKRLTDAFSLGGLGGKGLLGEFTKGFVSALAPVALLTAAIAGTKKALADLGKIADDVKPTGLKPELYQALGLAAREAGVDQESLNAALNIFVKNVGLAQSGTGALSAGLKKLNPELLKNILAAKNQDERLRLVSDALNRTGDASRRAAIEAVVFGKSGVKLGEVFANGAHSLDEFIRKGKELGVIFSEADLAKADELSDKIDVLNFAIEQNLNKSLINLAPLLVKGSEGMLVLSQSGTAMGKAIERIGQAFELLGNAILGGERGVAEVKAEIAEVEEELERLADLAKAGIEVDTQTERAQENLKELQEELKRVGTEAEKAAAAANAALNTIAADPRAGGFAFKGQRDFETGQARDFLEERRTGDRNAKRALEARTEEILNDAKEEGIELTEEAARAEAELELAREAAGKAGEEAQKKTNTERERQNELIKDTIDNLQEETASIEFEREHLSDANSERERARVVFETLNRLQSEGITITDELRAAVEAEANARGQQVAAYDAAEAAAEAYAEAQEELARQQEEINDAFKDSLKSFISDLAHGKSATEALTDALGRLADRLIDIGIDQLFGDSGGGGGGDLISRLFGGGGGSAFKANTTLSQVLGVGGGGVDPQVTSSITKSMTAGATAAVNSGGVAGKIWSFFAGKGLKDFQVAGILGNVKAESAFNPTAVGDAGQAFGLFQHNDRKGALFNAIGGKGNLTDVTRQLEFAWKELETTERAALEALKASTDVRGATAAFAGFERPRGFTWDNPEGAHNFTGRLKGAEEALARFGGTTSQATSGLGGVSAASAAATAGLGEAASGLSKFGSTISSFLSSSSGGGSGWFQGLASLFGGAGGAFNFMNSISPAATASIIGAGGGFTGLYASGIDSAPAGWAVVGENGPEMIRLRGGEKILSNEQSMRLPRLNRASGGAGGVGSRPAPNVAITVITQDAPSFMRSQNQIANKTASSVDRAYRTT